MKKLEKELAINKKDFENIINKESAFENKTVRTLELKNGIMIDFSLGCVAVVSLSNKNFDYKKEFILPQVYSNFILALNENGDIDNNPFKWLAYVSSTFEKIKQDIKQDLVSSMDLPELKQQYVEVIEMLWGQIEEAFIESRKKALGLQLGSNSPNGIDSINDIEENYGIEAEDGYGVDFNIDFNTQEKIIEKEIDFSLFK